jgi:hypothetical protein
MGVVQWQIILIMHETLGSIPSANENTLITITYTTQISATITFHLNHDKCLLIDLPAFHPSLIGSTFNIAARAIHQKS